MTARRLLWNLAAPLALSLLACSTQLKGKPCRTSDADAGSVPGSTRFECRECNYYFNQKSRRLQVRIRAKTEENHRLVVVAMNDEGDSESFALETDKDGRIQDIFEIRRLTSVVEVEVAERSSRFDMTIDGALDPGPGYPCSQCTHQATKSPYVKVTGTWTDQQMQWYPLSNIGLLVKWKDGKGVVQTKTFPMQTSGAAGSTIDEKIDIGPYTTVTTACIVYKHSYGDAKDGDCKLDVSGGRRGQKL